MNGRVDDSKVQTCNHSGERKQANLHQLWVAIEGQLGTGMEGQLPT